MNKKIKIFIILSVVLNVLFVGLFCGFVINHPHHFGSGGDMDKVLEKSNLPVERQAFIKTNLNIIFDIGYPREEMEKMRDEAFKILTAENFDEVAYQEQMNKISDTRSQQRKNMGEAIKNIAKQLSLPERQALAEILKNMPHKR